MRRGRLIVSNFGCVLKVKWVIQFFLKCFFGEYDLFGVKVVQWGVNNEQEVFKVFIVLIGKIVQEIGIWLDVLGIFGVFFDGIVDYEIVLEVKCFYIERNLLIEEVIVILLMFCLEKVQDGNGYVLKKDYVYWDQVQGEMFFIRRKFCYFVVWIFKDVVVVKIE